VNSGFTVVMSLIAMSLSSEKNPLFFLSFFPRCPVEQGNDAGITVLGDTT